jgi:hypothetical protein
VKVTDGWDGIESATALSFLIQRAHMVLVVYPLSILLEGIPKTNDLELVCMCPSSIVDVFEAESSNESG